jgi:hypothetical protein
MSPYRNLPTSFPVAVALTLALSMGSLWTYAQSDCLEFASVLELEVITDVNVAEPIWLEAETEGLNVYRLEISASDGSSVEVWTVDDDGGFSCPLADQRIARAEVVGGNATVEWTSGGWEAILLTPGGEGEIFSLTMEVAASRPTGRRLTIPAVARTPGKQGTFFQSDLRIFNRSSEERAFQLVLAPSDGSGEQRVDMTIAPHRIVRIDDLMLSVFERDQAVGALRIEGGSDYHDLIITSRTYTSSDQGTYGQFIGADWWQYSAGVGDHWEGGPVRTLLHLAESADYRTNVGFAEVMGLDAVIDIELFDALGNSLGSKTVTVPAFGHRQINDVFQFVGAAPEDNAMIVSEVRNNARVFSYASVVDNRSGDPIFIPGASSADAEDFVVIPAVAAVRGKSGTEWRSDVRVLALGAGAIVGVSFKPSDGSEAVFQSFTVNDNQLLAIDDVVSALGGSGSGALTLESRVPLIVTSRTYNLTDYGTYGQFIPGDPWWAGGRSLTMVGIDSSADFRSNVGFYNPYIFIPLDATVRLVNENGVLLDSDTWHLEPRTHIQLNDVFTALGAEPETNCRVDVSVPGLGYRVFAYASVIDNRTGDPVYIPGSWAAPPSPVLQLDNQNNAILIDQLPEAVGVESLPSGIFTATVSGSGDLGQSGQELQVLCMFKSFEVGLRSVVLPVGGSVTDVAGGQPLWCVIPDLESTADNTGIVTVSVTGGGGQVTLDLDGRENAVAIDQILEAVSYDRPPKESYRAVVSGDFGDPSLAPQGLFMHRRAVSGELEIRAFSDGQVFEDIGHEDRLVVAMVDWLSRNDNTGVTAFDIECTTRVAACGDTVTGTIAATDCQFEHDGFSLNAERIPFSVSAGTRVTINATWEHLYGLITLEDPSGEEIAAAGSMIDPAQPSMIEDVLLGEAGEYVVWVVTNGYDPDLDLARYSVEIGCQEPENVPGT